MIVRKNNKVNNMDINEIKLKEIKSFDIQRKIVSHMTSSSWENIPHVVYVYEPDITDFYDEFRQLSQNGIKNSERITFNTVMIKVVAEGLKAAPELNSLVEYNRLSTKGYLYISESINVSVPWVLPDNRMFTPIVPNIERKSISEISHCIADIEKRICNTDINEMLYKTAYCETINELKRFRLATLVRVMASRTGDQKIMPLKGLNKEKYYKIPENKRLTEKDILNATVTVSNIGSLYKDQKGFFGLLEIIPPQVLAVGIGSIQERPGVYTDRYGTKQIGIRKILPMSLAFDHRAVDFSSLVPFLKRLDQIFQKPSAIRKW